jgi:RNA polymerase sigma-70 factor (ECF subfamily)
MTAPVPQGLPEPVLTDGLVAAAVTGDRRAREQLLAEIHPIVLRYCRARLGRHETVVGSADDVAQDVCLAVVGALPGYTVKGLSFRAFVYGIAAHKVTDAFRAIGRNRTDPVAVLPDTPVVRDSPEQRLLGRELVEKLGGLLHVLTPRQREVLVLRIAMGLSAEETAVVVSSTAGAVRVTQHRALIRLRREMGRPGSAPPYDAAPDDAAPDDAGPDDAAPDATAPDATAPDDAAPDGAAPDGAAPGLLDDLPAPAAARAGETVAGPDPGAGAAPARPPGDLPGAGPDLTLLPQPPDAG